MSWKIDNAHSQIEFTVRHMMISNVRGRFEHFGGTVEFDEADPTRSTVKVEIEAASINTKDDKRDTHLRSADFLDAEHNPTITYKSRRIEKVDDHHGRIIGDLSVRGKTREVVLDVEYSGQAKSPWGKMSAGFTASTKLNRKEWGLSWNMALETGGVLVGDEVNVQIELEIIKEDASEAVAG